MRQRSSGLAIQGESLTRRVGSITIGRDILTPVLDDLLVKIRLGLMQGMRIFIDMLAIVQPSLQIHRDYSDLQEIH